ncbi:MAG: fused MFS/spermidine synthase [Anaerolineaceae bacterium]|nr:fused MFS/spermidine synthase [Anaerolineaceae bacterium]
MRPGLLYLTIFVCGMSTLAIELTASRLLGNVFGTSNLVWANVIGLMLLYLSVGYFLGGRLADRHPGPRNLFRLVLWAAFFSALIPLLSRPILQGAANAVINVDAVVVVGAFLSVLVLFAGPVTLLGCVPPFAMRLAIDDLSITGQVSGKIYAISTLGSLLGTFLPVLVFIPEIGTRNTFLLFAALLYLMAIAGLWLCDGRFPLRNLWMPLVIALIVQLVSGGPLRAAPPGRSLLLEQESAYNYIQVQEDSQGYRYLYLNEGQGIHSQWHPERINFGRTWSFFLTAPWFNEFQENEKTVESLAIVGLAGGTVARQYHSVYGEIPIDGIEIDSALIDVARDWFGMDAIPGLRTWAADGRVALRQLPRQYSVIALDAYRPPYIPWHLTTVEFLQEARGRLLPTGALAVNVGRTHSDRRLVDAMTATLLLVFPDVHVMDVPNSFNSILVATSQRTQTGTLARNLASLPQNASPVLREALALGVESLVPTVSGDLIFRDDHAPVERLVDSLVQDFLLSGDAARFIPAPSSQDT